jgi:allophanate hydrolase subunit 1
MELDLNLRARIHCLEQQLAAANVTGLVETNAGVRSVMIEYDTRQLALPDLLALISKADAEIGDVAHMVLPSRIVHLPMAFDERCAQGGGNKLEAQLCFKLLTAAIPHQGQTITCWNITDAAHLFLWQLLTLPHNGVFKFV